MDVFFLIEEKIFRIRNIQVTQYQYFCTVIAIRFRLVIVNIKPSSS